MWTACKRAKTEIRALIVGWLTVALLLPALLAPAASQPLTPAEALFHQIEQANCLAMGEKSPAPGQHKVHDHECCLPNLTAAQFLTAPAVTLRAAAVTQLAAVDPASWNTPATHPHQNQSGIPRGPPSLLI
ncbi:hypothetical protein [Aestuariivirga litoralis]|uniref:hypothetical protein n=1 Tax=Aestuariivirga litoralis TaxID=2650924 RepID=UPI0018C5430E|nr:hypothetical protein [Aestuariivirga litoralis]MBG1232265.1 hypothetical protein [Aestuariivirga litoralis]